MPNTIELKPPLTIDQQLEVLNAKGLVIDHIEEAHQFLTENNYYRLNIYFHKFMDSKDHFISGTTFSKLINVHENDTYLRQQVFSMLEPIEINFKTKIAYFLGNKYGSDVFYKKEIYKSSWNFEQIANSLWREISRNEKDPVISHHYEWYYGYLPIWVIVEYLTFGCISKYFVNLQEVDQKEIATNYFGINEYYLANWIHSLSVMRNICAHFGYLYKRNFNVSISFGSDREKYHDQENTLFGIFYSIKKLAKNACWQNFYTKVCQKIDEEILIKDYEFPSNLETL
jgi:abortive infection bacteriophage resistance protein